MREQEIKLLKNKEFISKLLKYDFQFEIEIIIEAVNNTLDKYKDKDEIDDFIQKMMKNKDFFEICLTIVKCAKNEKKK